MQARVTPHDPAFPVIDFLTREVGGRTTSDEAQSVPGKYVQRQSTVLKNNGRFYSAFMLFVGPGDEYLTRVE